MIEEEKGKQFFRFRSQRRECLTFFTGFSLENLFVLVNRLMEGFSSSTRLAASQDSGKQPAKFVKQWTPRERRALRTLLIFSFAMIILPISGYFAFKYVLLEGILGWADGAIGGAISSVVIIHVLIAIYVFLAFTEDTTKTD